MKVHKVLFVSLVAASLLAAAEQPPPTWLQGKVLSQEMPVARVGAYAGPLGAGQVAFPLYRRANFITLDTPPYLYKLVENPRERHPLVLVVNDTASYYRDGEWFIFLDTKSRKHKFSVVSVTRYGGQ